MLQDLIIWVPFH